MKSDRDPQLEALFADAATASPSDDFTGRVMQGIARRHRNILLGRIAIVALIVLLEVLLSAPVQSSVGFIVEVLGTPLIELGESMLALMLTPINSVAGVLGGVLLLVHYLYRKMLR